MIHVEQTVCQLAKITNLHDPLNLVLGPTKSPRTGYKPPPQLKSGGFKSSNESSKHIVTCGPLRAF